MPWSRVQVALEDPGDVESLGQTIFGTIFQLEDILKRNKVMTLIKNVLLNRRAHGFEVKQSAHN